jgi:hypothetical protein
MVSDLYEARAGGWAAVIVSMDLGMGRCGFALTLYLLSFFFFCWGIR